MYHNPDDTPARIPRNSAPIRGLFCLQERLKKLFTNVWNVPNALTMLRLVLVPVFIVLFLRGQRIAALVVFCVASLTDMLDGQIARRTNQVTDFGKLFDPLADKLMVLSALICHGAAGHFPWSAILIVGIKEVLMILGGAVLLRKGIVVQANLYGKVATVFFMAALILAFFHEELAARNLPLDVILLWVSVGLTLLALVVYAVQAWKKLRKV